MIWFCNVVAVVLGAVGLIILLVGRVPIPGGKTRRGILVRLAGVLLLLPWPMSQGLALTAKAARELDRNPPDKPETV